MNRLASWNLGLDGSWDMATWFCDAYASWQKGGVENTNGRLRRRTGSASDGLAWRLPAWLSSQHLESHFFKSVLSRDVASGKRHFRIGIDESLLIDAANAFHVANVESIPGAAVVGALAFELGP